MEPTVKHEKKIATVLPQVNENIQQITPASPLLQPVQAVSNSSNRNAPFSINYGPVQMKNSFAIGSIINQGNIYIGPSVSPTASQPVIEFSKDANGTNLHLNGRLKGDIITVDGSTKTMAIQISKSGDETQSTVNTGIVTVSGCLQVEEELTIQTDD